ncbi:MAG: DUF6544 family protein [Chloroflexota bacterium]
MTYKRNDDRRIISDDMLVSLPEPVQRYMQFSCVVGNPWIETVRLEQTGTFRTGADRPWMPVTAVETYTTEPPTLAWDASFKFAGLPLIRVRDRYQSGEGQMLGKLAGFYTIFDAQGEELAQASMLRYLNEVMWFPTAFLGENMSWEAIDNRSARVTFTDYGRSVSADIFFAEDGRMINFKALRYRETDGKFSLDRWSTPLTEYGERGGLKIPVRGQAVWNLESGDLPYADLLIGKVEYNSVL